MWILLLTALLVGSAWEVQGPATIECYSRSGNLIHFGYLMEKTNKKLIDGEVYIEYTDVDGVAREVQGARDCLIMKIPEDVLDEWQQSRKTANPRAGF